MKPEMTETELRALLRHGDPGDDGVELSTQEVARIRSRMMNTGHTPDAVRWLPLAVAAAAAILAAVLLIPSSPPPTPAPRVVMDKPSGAPEAGSPAASDTKRQVRFATDRGTQIIWVLDPDLEL